MRKRAAVLIDGGHLRVLVRTKAKKEYNPAYIHAVAHACVMSDEEDLLRIYYYDCAPYNRSPRLPVSGDKKEFSGSDHWLRELASRDLFAVRLGVLKFRGFKPRSVPIEQRPLTDDDFKPDFEQKGVDMRIGLDIATFAASRAVDRIILITNDTDCIPAMKHGRKAGIQIALAALPRSKTAPELLHHSDFHRKVPEWPV